MCCLGFCMKFACDLCFLMLPASFIPLTNGLFHCHAEGEIADFTFLPIQFLLVPLVFFFYEIV